MQKHTIFSRVEEVIEKMDAIAVSIMCNTYNHEKYIKKALQSFIDQITDFKYEILIHDDASTDRTAEIIREFEKKYPEVIKPIYQTENQYKKNDGTITKLQYGRVKGKYIAFCEGDDYWIDPRKLQKQYDAMESHTEVDICAHRAIQIREDTEKVMCEIAPRKKSTVINVEDVIMGEGAFVATNSLFYRAKLNENIPPFRQLLVLDYTLQIQGALRGGMLYLSDNMSAYRFMSVGSWTIKQAQSVEKRKEFLDIKQKMLMQLDADTDMKYSEVIKKRMELNELMFVLGKDDYKTALQKKYRSARKHLGISERMKIVVKAVCPFVYKVKRKIVN